MNTTPLIDVMLVLLVLLIVTLPIQTHAVKITMPSGPTSPITPTIVELGVDFDGGISLERQPHQPRHAGCLSCGCGEAKVRSRRYVNPNRLANYDVVAKVLADAQRLGATQIGFPGIDQYR